MKNHRTYWEHMKQHSKQFRQYSKRIVTTTLLAGTLVLPGNAAEAELSACVDCNCAGYSDVAIDAPSKRVDLALLSPVNAAAVTISTYPATATRTAVPLFSDMPLYGLQTHAFAPIYLHQHAPDFITEYESGFTVDNDGFLAVFSW